MKIKTINVHVLSDGSCETAGKIKRAVFRQFKNVKTKTFFWPSVRSKKKINEFIEELKLNKGIVMYSMVNPSLADYLMKEVASVKKCLAFNVIWYSVIRVGKFLKQKPLMSFDKAAVDEDLFSAIDAISFSNDHDDGRKVHDVKNADIVILGPSRSSKTPCSIYLAQRGIKAINIPITGLTDVLPIDDLKKHKCVFGFQIDPERLQAVRKNRFSPEITPNYYDMINIQTEVINCNKIYSQLGAFVINVTARSIEEICSQILNVYYKVRK